MTNHKWFIVAVILIFSAAFYSFAEETVVVGNIVDVETQQPIENANIYYKGTKIGTTSTSEGVFLLRTDNSVKATLIVSAVGYRQQKYQIEPGTQSGLQVEMQPKTTDLADIFVIPGENPALELMRRVREHRAANDFSGNDSLITSLSLTQRLFISHLPARHLSRLLADTIASRIVFSEDSLALMPVYQTERQLQICGNTTQTIGSPVTTAAGASEQDYELLLSSINQRPYNFYRQSVSILSHDFTSPLSTAGNSVYNYYLVDSLNAPKRYIVDFVPKNSYSYCLKGSLEIDSLTYAVMHIKAQIPRQSPVNYLTEFSVEQQFLEDKSLKSEELSATLEMSVKSDTSHLFPSVMLERSIAQKEESKVETSLHGVSSKKSETGNEEVRQAIEATNESLLFRIARMAAYIINTGNIPTGTMIDVGNVVEIMGGSSYEGFHFALPFTTNERLSKYVELSAYLAYGFGDRAYKGKGQVRVKLPTDRRQIIGAYYWDRYGPSDLSELYYRLRENDVFYADQDFAHMVFSGIRRQSNYTLSGTRRRELRIWTENEITDNIETQFQFLTGRMGYGDIMQILAQGPQSEIYQRIPSYRFTTVRAELRLGFHERKVDLFMKRIHVRNHYPVVHFMLEAGTYQTDLMERNRLYARASVLVRQTVSLGICGQLDYAAMAGMVFGRVPYPLLEHFVGNQSYTYDPYRFTLASQMEFAADRFLMTHLHWNMQGLMFNAIPYIQRLHLRELVEMKLAWGSLNYDHQSVVPFPATLGTLKVPYIEAGVGIGNILRIADIYAVFRLTHNSTAGNGSQPANGPFWGIRARFSLGL